MKKGHVRPVFPPSVFSLPKSFSRQTSTIPRNVEARNVDAASRANISEAKNKSADGVISEYARFGGTFGPKYTYFLSLPGHQYHVHACA